MNKKPIIFLISLRIIFLLIVVFIFKYHQKDILCQTYYVDKIYDGDTINAVGLGKVRLLGIDTPEIYSDQYGFLNHKFYGCANESKELAREKLLGKDILFCSDKSSQDKGKYDRKLRYVMINLSGDNISFGYFLLQKGLAKTYKYGNFQKKSKFLKKEKELKNKFQGIWSKECQIQDLKFRKKYGTGGCMIKGNISNIIGRVYHFPNDTNRGKVKINKDGEYYFCDNKQAELSGFQRIGDILKERNLK